MYNIRYTQSPSHEPWNTVSPQEPIRKKKKMFRRRRLLMMSSLYAERKSSLLQTSNEQQIFTEVVSKVSIICP